MRLLGLDRGRLVTEPTLDYPGDLLGFAGDLTPRRARQAGAAAGVPGRQRPSGPRRALGARRVARRLPASARRPHLLDDPELIGEGGGVRPLYPGFVTLELCRLDLAISITYGDQVGCSAP